MKLIQNYIDGRFVPGKREFPDVNPANGTEIAQVAEADEGHVDEAVHAARRALRGEWGRLEVRERAGRLHKVAEAIEKRFDCFVQAEVADTGKPVSLASKLDVPRAAANFRVFADLVKTLWAGIVSDGNSGRNECSELRGTQAAGRCRCDHAVESAVAVAYLESRAGAGLRQCGGGQAFGRNSGYGYAAGGGDGGSGNPERRL